MTVGEVIEKADGLKQNDYTTKEKVEWINRLESKVIHEVIFIHIRHREKSPSVIIELKDGENSTIELGANSELSNRLIGTMYSDVALTDSDEDLDKPLIIPHLIREIDSYLERHNSRYTLDGVLTEEALNDLYIDYIHMQIDYYNGEVDRYNNSATRFNTAYDEFKKYYTSVVPHPTTPNFRRY